MDANIVKMLPSPKPSFIAHRINIMIKTTPMFFQQIKLSAEKHQVEVHQQATQSENTVMVNTDNFAQIFGEAMMNMENLTGVDPSKDVKTKLLQHQRLALEWLMKHENPENDVPSHVKKVEAPNGDVYWVDKFSEQRYEEPPPQPKGGLLADDMGLGKTLSMISLLVSNSKSPTTGTSLGATLIVCPLAVMNNWHHQVKEHCNRGALRCLEYHGSDRIGDPEYLREFDMVITTYHIVAQESKMEDTGLHAVKWLRVCLDEAHIIRSRKTKMWRACTALTAERRWALTGTPVQNKLDDLFSLFAFLRLKPWTEYKYWKTIILNQIKPGNNTGIQL
eukprot:UN24742